jgi:hypothetical protein
MRSNESPKLNATQRSSKTTTNPPHLPRTPILQSKMQTRSQTRRSVALCPAASTSLLLSALPVEVLHAVFDYVPKPDLFVRRRAGKRFKDAVESYFALWLRTGPRSLFCFVRVDGCRDHGGLVGARDNGPHLLVRKGMEGGWIRYEVASGRVGRRHLAYRCNECWSFSAAGDVRVGLRLAELAPLEFEVVGDSTYDVTLRANERVAFPEWGGHFDLVRTEGSFVYEHEPFTESEDSLVDYSLVPARLSAEERAMYNHPVDLADVEDLVIAGAVVHASEVGSLLPDGLREWYAAFVGRMEGEEGWEAVLRDVEEEEVGRWDLKRAEEMVEMEENEVVPETPPQVVPETPNPGEIEDGVEEEDELF